MENKKAVIYSMVALIALVILVVGATYAYFQNQYGSASNADVNVTTYTTDVLTFETGDAISLYADQTSFGQEKGSLSGQADWTSQQGKVFGIARSGGFAHRADLCVYV